MGIAAAIGLLSPFPFYYCLWIWPQWWVDLCGRGREARDPSKVMAYVSYFLKLVQFISLFYVSSFHWPPPFYFWPLIAFGQFLNFRSSLTTITTTRKLVYLYHQFTTKQSKLATAKWDQTTKTTIFFFLH